MRLYCICVALLLSFSVAYAQEATPEGWTIEQRCVGEASTPPEGWSFDGAILMTGYAGIHAVSVQYETPYVVVFVPRDYRVGGGGVLSPDGNWYAVLGGENTECEIMCAGGQITSIRVYSTAILHQYFELDWNNDYSIGSQGYHHPLYWYDNELILYESDHQYYLINPFTGEYSEENLTLDIRPDNGFVPSPDWTVAIIDGDYGMQDSWYVTEDNILVTPIDAQARYAAWKNDSSGFVAVLPSIENPQNYTRLALYDRDGNVLEVIYDGFSDIGRWSPDDRYLTFVTNTLHVADTQERLIIDLCISVNRSMFWSPNGTHLAVTSEDMMRVVDLDVWTQYIVGYQQGSIIGWRADE